MNPRSTVKRPSDAELNQLLRERVILLDGEIDDDLANLIIAQLLFLESEDPTRTISLHINSHGGSVTAGLAIRDVIQSIKPPVSTRCVGQAASMAAILLAAGARGEREAMPNCQVMINKPRPQSEPKSGLERYELQRLMWALVDILVSDTGRSAQQVEADMESAHFMSPEEALEHGYIDRIL